MRKNRLVVLALVAAGLALFLLPFCPVSATASGQNTAAVYGTCSWRETEIHRHELDKSQKKILLEYVISKLSLPEKTLEPPDIPFRPEGSSNIAFISVSDGIRTAAISCGEGKNLGFAIESALQALAEDRSRIPDPLWVKIDIVKEVRIYEKAPMT